MTALLERELRDLLAEQLDVLEPGLALVRCEFPLSDPQLRTRGWIDILARDRHGLWVIIELKRDASKSREALHEVAKYAELLQRDKQVAPDRIRALIVSTDWRGLPVPVSNMARDWSHDLRGYKLQVHDDRTLSAERVVLLTPSPEHYITPVHGIYRYASPQDRDRGWKHIRQIASKIGAPNLLAADFECASANDSGTAHYGLYLGVGTVAWGSALSDSPRSRRLRFGTPGRVRGTERNQRACSLRRSPVGLSGGAGHSPGQSHRGNHRVSGRWSVWPGQRGV